VLSVPERQMMARKGAWRGGIQAMCLGNTVDQVAADVLYIHPALTEVIELTLLEL
jgi:hypothetical protein